MNPAPSAHGFRRAVFFDRDGTLNHLVHRPGFRIRGEDVPYTAPFCVEELRLIEGVAEVISEVRRRGYLVIVITNQPDVANGFIAPDEYAKLVQTFRNLVSVDDFSACMHRPDAGCACRKPSPELILRAAERHRIDLSSSFMVGDMESDMRAGHAAGVSTVLITKDLSRASIARYRAKHVRGILPLIK